MAGLIGSTVKTDRRTIQTNAKTLHAQIEACTATTAGMTIPDVQTLRNYLKSYHVVLSDVNGRVPTVFESRDDAGNDIIVSPDDPDPAYGDFVLIRPTSTSYELRYVGKDGFTYPAFTQ
jgi:hypothetical protein